MMAPASSRNTNDTFNWLDCSRTRAESFATDISPEKISPPYPSGAALRLSALKDADSLEFT